MRIGGVAWDSEVDTVISVCILSVIATLIKVAARGNRQPSFC